MDNNTEGRVIKFRAWTGEEMVFVHTLDIYPDSPVCRVNTSVASHYNKWPLMQFTGLHDKNGREIYEGDIVKVTNAECVGHDDDGNEMFEDAIGQVYFESGSFVYNGHTVGEIPIEYQIEETEVIGNIYENPNLLKQ